MFNSFSTALSALNADSTALDVVGNNLANLNTPGYKASVAYFHDLVSQSMGMGETQIGFGTARPITIRQFTQGAIQASGGLLDAGIQGDGFFVLRDIQGAPLYTRAGGFQVDMNGRLLTPTGEHVQGWSKIDPATGNADTSGTIGDITIPVGTLKAPQTTGNMSLDVNLNAGAAADATSSFATSIEVFDSLGQSHVLTFTFQKTKANEWTFDLTIPGEDVAAGTPGTPQKVTPTSHTLKFDETGKLTDPASGNPFVVNLAGLTDGAADMTVNWNLYDSAGTPRLTQHSQPSAVSAESQDGAAAAQLIRVRMADDARVVAQYSTGSRSWWRSLRWLRSAIRSR